MCFRDRLVELEGSGLNWFRTYQGKTNFTFGEYWMESLNLRIGGMESRKDVQVLREVLESLPGIEAYDVKSGRVRIGYSPALISMATIFGALAQAGEEGYDIEME